jgi:hypothetical protein
MNLLRGVPLVLALALIVLCGSLSAQNTHHDRTVLPVSEPQYPQITELDARNAEAPPRFEVKAPSETKAGPPVGAPVQHFVCNIGYSLSKCQAEMAVLKKTLAKYPAAELGEWTWVLVRSADWKYIVMSRGLDPDGPAFTYLPKRETFIEEALVATVPQRLGELIWRWGMSTDDLLDLAVAHELAHVLCNEPSEAKARRRAKALQEGKPLSCEARVTAKMSTEEMRNRR